MDHGKQFEIGCKPRICLQRILKEFAGIEFKYFDSKLVDEIPEYEYLLKDGVSNERLGLYIVKKEKIIEILNSVSDN